MSSGYSGGGSEFYSPSSGGVRPRSSFLTNNTPQIPMQQPSPFFRSQQQQQQLRGIFADGSSSQIALQTASVPPPPLGPIGKRTLTEFQTQAALNNLLLRSVRPRPAVIPPNSGSFEYPGPIPSQRYGVPLLHQLRPHPINLANAAINSTNQTLTAVPCTNQSSLDGVTIPNPESENKMMNRLQELEKHLLDDIDEEDTGDAVSVITNTNSEWSEAIQSLISPTQKPISSSPSSSSSSSSPSSSISVASPVSVCLKQSLVEAAAAIYDGRTDVAGEILMRLSASSNPRGSSEQRLMDYVLSALKSRVNPGENPPPVAELFSQEHVQSTQTLYDLSPCFKLGFLAANFAIMEAALEPPVANKLHVIDFDIGSGGQYQNLLHALSTRQAGKPSVVKITAVSDDRDGEERLTAVGDQLIQLATTVGVVLCFNVVSQNLGELTRDSLGCENDEVLAVNLAFKLYKMPDESVSVENPRDELLRRVKGLSPRVVTLVEQEWNANTAPFMTRVNEAFGYYGALLESVESTVARESPERGKVEEGLGRKVANSIACEGRERVERSEVFGKWRARMGMAGFQLRPMSQHVVESMKTRLSSGNRVNPGFTVKEEGGGGVGFGWLGRTLTVASAWR